MDYKVIVTADAAEDLDQFISYLLFVKKNPQAARSVLNDFEETKNQLANIAGSLKDCENAKLQQYGYKRLRTSIIFSSPVPV